MWSPKKNPSAFPPLPLDFLAEALMNLRCPVITWSQPWRVRARNTSHMGRNGILRNGSQWGCHSIGAWTLTCNVCFPGYQAVPKEGSNVGIQLLQKRDVIGIEHIISSSNTWQYMYSNPKLVKIEKWWPGNMESISFVVRMLETSFGFIVLESFSLGRVLADIPFMSGVVLCGLEDG